MNPNQIGKFIYELRTEKGWSQYQLAEMIPISRQAVSKWERGQTIPDSSTLLRLSDIFDVTINELLNGERIKENSIEELESTTLNLVDETNRKTKKLKKIGILSMSIITLLIVSFLGYYFINSYNTIKVYKIYAESKNFDIYDGIFITLKEKSYFKLGKIAPKNDNEIKSIKVYYKDNNKKKIIIENDEVNKIVADFSGFSETLKNKKYRILVNNTYIEIKYNDNKKEVIKINYKRDFTNNNLLFERHHFNGKKKVNKTEKNAPKEEIKEVINEEVEEEQKVEEKVEEPKIETVEEMMEKAIEKRMEPSTQENNNTNNVDEKVEPNADNKEENINQEKEESKTVDAETKLDLIVEKGEENFGNYVLKIEENGSEIRFMYMKMMNQVIMFKDNENIWTYVHARKLYKCEKVPTGDANNNEECKNYVNYCLNKYIN